MNKTQDVSKSKTNEAILNKIKQTFIKLGIVNKDADMFLHVDSVNDILLITEKALKEKDATIEPTNNKTTESTPTNEGSIQTYTVTIPKYRNGERIECRVNDWLTLEFSSKSRHYYIDEPLVQCLTLVISNSNMIPKEKVKEVLDGLGKDLNDAYQDAITNLDVGYGEMELLEKAVEEIQQAKKELGL